MKFPEFTPEAKEKWDKLPKEPIFEILKNHYCLHCSEEREMQLTAVETIQCDLLLTGICKTCGGEMKRVIEIDE